MKIPLLFINIVREIFSLVTQFLLSGGVRFRRFRHTRGGGKISRKKTLCNT